MVLKGRRKIFFDYHERRTARTSALLEMYDMVEAEHHRSFLRLSLYARVVL